MGKRRILGLYGKNRAPHKQDQSNLKMLKGGGKVLCP